MFRVADKKLFDFHMKFACLERLPFLLGSIGTIFEENNISGDVSLKLQLILEEAVSNVIIHGYGKKGGYIAMSAIIKGDILEIEIRDHAKKFDPMSVSTPDITLKPEDRKPGGLGIHMIRKIMDKVVYGYENGENIILMTKKIK